MKRTMIIALDFIYIAFAVFIAIWLIFEPFWPNLAPIVPFILGLFLLAAAIATPRREMQSGEDET